MDIDSCTNSALPSARSVLCCVSAYTIRFARKRRLLLVLIITLLYYLVLVLASSVYGCMEHRIFECRHLSLAGDSPLITE